MARGSKTKYSEKQKRQADDIAAGYMRRGVSRTEAKRRAWATVNRIYGGGAKGGSGSRRPVKRAPMDMGGRKAGAASSRRPASARSASAQAARTRAGGGY